MMVTVAFRYVGIALQFVILAVLARTLGPHDYGQYILVLSAVLPTYFLLGAGASESFVREASHLDRETDRDEVASLVGAVALSVASTSAVVIIAGLVGIVVRADLVPVLAFGVAYFVANGLMFNAAQILIATGADVLGGFFFYPALNVCLVVSTVPYVLLSDSPSFTGVAWVTSSVSAAAAAGAWIIVVRRASWSIPSSDLVGRLVRAGARLAAARALYSIGLWLPTLVAGLLLAVSQAGIMGTAGRLAAAVAAVTAAFRFAVRPTIVRQNKAGDLAAIGRTAGRLGLIGAGVAIGALGLALFVAGPVVGAVFGDDFDRVVPILLILLLGVAVEAAAGPVDEILKMTGHERTVLGVFLVALPFLAFGLWWTSTIGVEAMAWSQVAYSTAVVIACVIAVRAKLGIWIYPSLRRPAASSSTASQVAS